MREGEWESGETREKRKLCLTEEGDVTDNKIHIKKGDTQGIAWVKAFLPRLQLKYIVAGAVIAILMAYDGRSGNFAGLRGGDVVWGALLGLGVSLAIDGASSVGGQWLKWRERRLKLADPFRNRATGRPRQNSNTTRNPARTIKLEDGRQVPLNRGRDSFETILTEGGTTITLRGKRDLVKALFGRSPAPVPRPVRPAPPINRPAEVDEIKFESYDRQGEAVQLLGGDVWRFLTIAWRCNARGSGLSLNRWSGKRYRLPDWYKGKGIGWYWAMLNLMAEAEEATGTRLVRVVWVNRARGVSYLVLTMNNQRVYEVLLYVEQQRIEEGTDVVYPSD